MSFLGPMFEFGVMVMGFFLDKMGASNDMKKQFYLFVAAAEADKKMPIRLSESSRSQLEQLKKELAEAQDSPPKPLT